MLVLPFPMARRRALVEKLARQMLARSPADADKHLKQELHRHRAVLARKPFGGAMIEAQLKSFESAVRTELRRLVMYPQWPNGDVA